jgi:hypothetical protein
MKVLLEFITAEDIKQIKKDVELGESLHNINRRYTSENKAYKSVLWTFLKKLKRSYPPNVSSGILGYKDEPYETEEQMATKPTYDYNDLSESEKSFYEIKENGKK